MKLVLRKNIEGLGNVGDVVEVHDGYARNYLIPRGLGCVATQNSVDRGHVEAKRQQEQDRKRHDELAALAEKLEGVSLTIKAHVGEDGKLFGSVSAQMITAALSEQGFDIDKKLIELETPIREVGCYPVPIKLSLEVKAEVKVWVVKD